MDLEQYLIKQKEDAVDKVVAALVHTSDKKIKEKMSNIKEMLNLIAHEGEREAVLRCIALDIIANCYTCDDEEDFNLEESISMKSCTIMKCSLDLVALPIRSKWIILIRKEVEVIAEQFKFLDSLLFQNFVI